MLRLARHHKEYLRYLIIAIIMFMNYDLTEFAKTLAEEGELTLEFTGIVASSYGVLTLVLGSIFNTKVGE